MSKNFRYRPFLLLVIILQLLLPIFVASPVVNAQSPSPFNMINDGQIVVRLSSEDDDLIQLKGSFVNTGEITLQQLEFRFDFRQLSFKTATINSENVSGTLRPEGRYTILQLDLVQPIEANGSREVVIELSSDILEERLGFDTNNSLELYQMIYYLRPVNEYSNLTFQLELRQHAILRNEQAAPLYPKPNSNYTDGASMGFLWNINSILPGQERVFIAKYAVPLTAVAESTNSTIWILYIVLAGFAGATVVLVMQRVPDLIRSMQPQIYSVNGSTKHEREIIRLIAKKNGSCPQREIYEELNLSQSMVSMLLTGLEERGIVRRFKEGRENIVHLIEDE